jgi:hypothetical protein
MKRLHEALKDYCGHAGMAVPFAPTDQIWRRLMHACGLRRGLALELLQEVVLDAWRAGKTLETQHFIERYRMHTGAAIDANPFYAAAWHLTDPAKFFEATIGAGAPLKGK